jgi:hypothetical protein
MVGMGDGGQRTVLILGAVGALAFLLGSTVDGLTRPGYSLVRHPVSALALGTRGWLQSLTFVLCGALIAAGGAGVWSASWLLGAGVIVLGLGLVASGIYPMDPARGYPPGTPDGDPPSFSRRHIRHDQAGAVVFFTMPVLPLVAALTSALPAPLRWVSALAAAVVAVGVGAFTKAWEANSPRAGLAQRLALAGGLGWLAAMLLVLAAEPV